MLDIIYSIPESDISEINGLINEMNGMIDSFNILSNSDERFKTNNKLDIFKASKYIDKEFNITDLKSKMESKINHLFDTKNIDISGIDSIIKMRNIFFSASDIGDNKKITK